ncbi:LEPR-XLL domain-containing protein [Fibrobacter sp. UWH5]
MSKLNKKNKKSKKNNRNNYKIESLEPRLLMDAA